MIYIYRSNYYSNVLIFKNIYNRNNITNISSLIASICFDINTNKENSSITILLNIENVLSPFF